MLNFWLPDYDCSVFENYGSPTLVTRLNIAPNMVDPISIKDSKSRLKMEIMDSLGLDAGVI